VTASARVHPLVAASETLGRRGSRWRGGAAHGPRAVLLPGGACPTGAAAGGGRAGRLGFQTLTAPAWAVTSARAGPPVRWAALAALGRRLRPRWAARTLGRPHTGLLSAHSWALTRALGCSEEFNYHLSFNFSNFQ
jgi:hypothetical protein